MSLSIKNAVSVLLFCYILLSQNEITIAIKRELCFTASDYGNALSKAILFFEGQRSGKLPLDQRVVWRADSALSDGELDNVNLTGGYYDAGDNVKFGWPMSFSVSLLSWAAIEYRRDISSIKQLSYLKAAIRWGTNFILQSHTSTTTFYTQVGNGTADHDCWERPEDMDTPRTLYKITENSPGSEAAADAAAALASASIVFKYVDSNYSSRLLRHSKSLFDFADKYRSSYQDSCPFYCSYSGYQDELLWAASWLYKASNNNKYLNYIVTNRAWSESASEFSWDNKLPGVQTLLTQIFYTGKEMLSKFKSDAESFICALMPGSSSLEIKTTPGGLLYTSNSSNLQYVSSSAMVLFIYSRTMTTNDVNGSVQCGSSNFSASQISAFAKSQVDYILGKNPMEMSYMVGFGNKYPTQPQHRGSSIPSIKVHPTKVGCNDGFTNYYHSPSPNPNVHVGAIVGGPDSNDKYNDSRSDYSHGEPTTYMNAAFVGSVAALVAQSDPSNCSYLVQDTLTSEELLRMHNNLVESQ